jgi:hypothetical protein
MPNEYGPPSPEETKAESLLQMRERQRQQLIDGMDKRTALDQATSGGGLATAGLALAALLAGEKEMATAIGLGGVVGTFQGAEQYNAQQEAAIQAADQAVQESKQDMLDKKWNLITTQPGAVGAFGSEVDLKNFLGLTADDQTDFLGQYIDQQKKAADQKHAESILEQIKGGGTNLTVDAKRSLWREYFTTLGRGVDEGMLNKLSASGITLDDAREYLPYAEPSSVTRAMAKVNQYVQGVYARQDGSTPDPLVQGQILFENLVLVGDVEQRKLAKQDYDKARIELYLMKMTEWMRANPGKSKYAAADPMYGALEPDEHAFMMANAPERMKDVDQMVKDNPIIHQAVASSLAAAEKHNNEIIQAAGGIENVDPTSLYNIPELGITLTAQMTNAMERLYRNTADLETAGAVQVWMKKYGIDGQNFDEFVNQVSILSSEGMQEWDQGIELRRDEALQEDMQGPFVYSNLKRAEFVRGYVDMELDKIYRKTKSENAGDIKPEGDPDAATVAGFFGSKAAEQAEDKIAVRDAVSAVPAPELVSAQDYVGKVRPGQEEAAANKENALRQAAYQDKVAKAERVARKEVFDERTARRAEFVDQNYEVLSAPLDNMIIPGSPAETESNLLTRMAVKLASDPKAASATSVEGLYELARSRLREAEAKVPMTWRGEGSFYSLPFEEQFKFLAQQMGIGDAPPVEEKQPSSFMDKVDAAGEAFKKATHLP